MNFGDSSEPNAFASSTDSSIVTAMATSSTSSISYSARRRRLRSTDGILETLQLEDVAEITASSSWRMSSAPRASISPNGSSGPWESA